MDCIKRLFSCCFSKKGDKKVEEPAEEKLVSNATGHLAMTGQKGEELATFGAGCYWGTEKYIVNVFGKKHPGAILG